VCGRWRIFQRRDGHRFSTDDFLCAWYAADRVAAHGHDPRTYLDLGTGIGSVALMTSWLLPAVHTVGIEAQAVSAALARRSIRFNGIVDRFEVREGDLRDESLIRPGEAFDLVTGSPPYLPLGSGVESGRTQRAPARFVHRGDVTGYAATAARVLAPGGLFALVYAAYRPDDVPAAADAAGLVILSRRTVVPRQGKDPLLDLLCLGRADEHTPSPAEVEPPLTVRDRQGGWTHEYQQVRASMGFPHRVHHPG